MAEIEITLPEDPAQTPDLFINVNVTTYPIENKKQQRERGETIVSNERVGFIRLNYKDLFV